jgi:hypothetical protein
MLGVFKIEHKSDSNEGKAGIALTGRRGEANWGENQSKAVLDSEAAKGEMGFD